MEDEVDENEVDEDEIFELPKYNEVDENLSCILTEPIPKRPYEHSTFVYLNCRGTEAILSRDSAELIPYLYSLLNGACKNNPRDKNGNFIVDENRDSLFWLIDMYRAWIEGNKPNGLFSFKSLITSTTSHNLYASVARRLGFEKEFVNAIITSQNDPLETVTFRCYYCKNIYSEKERKRFEECSYHEQACECRHASGRWGCVRVPYHSKVPIADAPQPKNNIG